MVRIMATFHAPISIVPVAMTGLTVKIKTGKSKILKRVSTLTLCSKKSVSINLFPLTFVRVFLAMKKKFKAETGVTVG